MMFYFFPQQDAAVRWQMGFQDPATPVAEGIFDFHHELFNIIIFIVVFVGILLARCIHLFHSKRNPIPAKFVHNTMAEIIWTLTPAYLLLVIAIPSFALLYSMDECIDPQVTIKAIGHQWYWSYEYSDYSTKEKDDFTFDSYMINDNDLQKGQLRLLEVDRRIVVPINTHVRVLTTSADVIHSWAVPSLGVKIDACPGRINQTSLFIKREGAFYGQCSEICGVNHGFMPIVVVGVKLAEYSDWLSNKGNVLSENGNPTESNEAVGGETETQPNLKKVPVLVTPEPQAQQNASVIVKPEPQVQNTGVSEEKPKTASENTVAKTDESEKPNTSAKTVTPPFIKPYEPFKRAPKTSLELHQEREAAREAAKEAAARRRFNELKKNLSKSVSPAQPEVKKDKLGDPMKPVSEWEPVPFNPKYKDKLGDPMKPVSEWEEPKNSTNQETQKKKNA